MPTQIDRKPRLAQLAAFVSGDMAGGLLMIAAAIVAVIWANSPAAPLYGHLLHLKVGLIVGGSAAQADLHFVINEALMAVFFLLVGLEIRHEVTSGELASLRRAAAPGIAALGGMVVPALIYVALTRSDPGALRGWAIPISTDIAFSLAVLRLLGPRVPPGLKVFLTALAIMDDVAAILVIAVFFTAGLDAAMLLGALAAWLVMYGCARAGLRRISFYILGFVVLWLFLVQSGVHATLAGVATAFAVPMGGPQSVGRRLEHGVADSVAFIILPLFALANAGLPLSSLDAGTLADPIVEGIALGLFAGKPLGVFGFTYVAAKLRLTALPEGLSWLLVFGGSVLCGIGFTMSLFIGLLAFPGDQRSAALRLAVFAASAASAALGAVIVSRAARRPAA